MTDPAPEPRRVFLGVSGASGSLYALRTLRMLCDAGVRVDLCVSPSARRVLREELDLDWDGADAAALLDGADAAARFVRVWDHADVGAPPASGTALGEAVVVVPCSLTTLSGLATGRAGNLIERAAQVALKEGRRLVVVPRETPLTRTHLDQLSALAWAGAVVLPAAPGFYHRPQTVVELVDHVAAKVLGVLGVPQSRVAPWAGGVEAEPGREGGR